jgi:hypothetical protein
MNELRLHRLGLEKVKTFENNFDRLYDEYKQKAKSSGYHGDLKFVKERGKIIIYVQIELPEPNKPLDDLDDLDLNY